MKMRRGIALIELVFAMVIIALVLTAVPNLISQTTKSSNQAITQEAISNAASELDMIMSSFWDENCTDSSIGNPVLAVDTQAPELRDVNRTIPDPSGMTMPGGGMAGGSMPGGGVPVGATPTPLTLFTNFRVGIPNSSVRRFYVDANGTKLSATNPVDFGEDSEDTEPDDIDDFNGKSIVLVQTLQNTTASEGDYKDIKIKIDLNVTYISDFASPSYYSNTITFNNPFSNEINSSSTNIKAIKLTLTSDNDPNKKVVLKSFSCNIGSGILKEKIF